jgi:hypothetical protein
MNPAMGTLGFRLRKPFFNTKAAPAFRRVLLCALASG